MYSFCLFVVFLHKLQLFNNASKDGVRGSQRNSFYHRVDDIWNKLPKKVAESKSINNNLDDHWNDVPSKYGSPRAVHRVDLIHGGNLYTLIIIIMTFILEWDDSAMLVR